MSLRRNPGCGGNVAGVVTYTHTPDGLPLRTTYAGGRWIENVYDIQRQIVGTLSSDGANDSTIRRDAYGRVAGETNAVASAVCSRADVGMATNEAAVVGGIARTLRRTVDGQGRLASFGLDGGYTAQTVSYREDGRIGSISNADVVVDYAYSDDGYDIGYTLSVAGGAVFTRTLTRDPHRRELVLNIANSAGGNFAYAYDAISRPVTRNDDAFGYNARSEVTSATIGGISSVYGYDEIGNSTNWTANCLNQYRHCVYDADGNMTACGPWSYTYDSANRLATVSSNGVLLVTNNYDARSRRVRKVTSDATTTFFYDDWNLVEEHIAYTNGTTSTIHYYWGKDLSGTLQGAGGVGGLLYLTVDGAVYIPCYDNNGNIMRYLDANGITVAAYAYDAFGRTISQSGTLADIFRHRFSTKYFDGETGLYDFGYRFYLPELCHWLTRDMLYENGGLNLYCFVENNPLTSVDRLGQVKYGDSTPWVKIDAWREEHNWNCIEWTELTDKKAGGTKDKFIAHFNRYAFKGKNVSEEAISGFSYAIPNVLGMDVDSKACWCLVMNVTLYTKRKGRNSQFKLKLNVIVLDKHPTCCPKPERHLKNYEGKTFEVGPY